MPDIRINPVFKMYRPEKFEDSFVSEKISEKESKEDDELDI